MENAAWGMAYYDELGDKSSTLVREWMKEKKQKSY